MVCGLEVPVLEGTGMGMHRRMHTPHYRYMQREKYVHLWHLHCMAMLVELL